MKNLWTDDADTIRQEIEFLIENKISLICGRRGLERMAKLPISGITISNNVPLLILYHPHEPSCSFNKCIFYYHVKGNPLRVFECTRIKKADKFVGFELPKQIFNIHKRVSQRIATPNNSIATFSIQNKQRIYNGIVEDISLEGTKLQVDIPAMLSKGSILCHITLTIYYVKSLKDETVINIPEAEVAWAKCDKERTTTVGLKFVLSEKNLDKLSNYIDLRSINTQKP